MRIGAASLIMAMILLALAVACGEALQSERIAFTVSGAPSRDTALGMGGNVDIYAMNPDGSGVRQLTKNPAYDWNPVWSPDGQRIAFVSERDGNLEIYAMNADGSDLTRLTNNDLVDWNPVWSPDGQRIAFSSSHGHGHSSIWTMNADGSEITQFFGGHNPVWSPDGKRIAFIDYPGYGDIIKGDYEIYVMNADGSGATQLTDNDVNDFYMSWRPAP